MAYRTIYLEYKVDDCDIIKLKDVYSATLASEDGTYGIKEIDSGNIIAEDGEAVTHAATGTYEFRFDTTPGQVYLVSWKIIPLEDNDPIYKEEQIGPFSDVEDHAIRAVVSKKGSYKPGTIATLFLKVTTIDGQPINATNVDVIIRNSSGTTVESGDPEKPTDGFYVYEWDIDDDQTNGDYNVSWEYVVDNVSYYEAQEIIVTEDIDLTSEEYHPITIALRETLSYYITCAQCIPVYFEQAKPTHDQQTYRFTFGHWNQTTGVKVFRNNRLIMNGLEINYFTGEVKFDDAMTPFDVVNADYSFKWFTDEELTAFLHNALQDFNTFPPHTVYSLTGSTRIPSRFLPGVIRKAAVDAIRHLMLCLQFQQPQQVFGGADAAKTAFANFETLKKNYEDEWFKLCENKKLGPYPSVVAVVVPEFTLPGGRSRWFRYLFSSGS